MNSLVPVIAIDGPSGVGKGTVSRALAKTLGWHYLDSGAIYRSLAIRVIQQKISHLDELVLAKIAENLHVSFSFNNFFKVFLDRVDVTEQLSTENCGNTASRIAALPKVREALLQKQREFRKAPGLVADGRDMGTVVFFDAPYKIYLMASPYIRAQRRYNQLKEKGMNVNLVEMTKEMEERDGRDKSRSNSPLKKAEDAVLIDSTDLSVEQVIERSLALLR